MKLIKPSFEVWEQSSGLEGIYKQIERCGRVCYKSEDKITEDSAKPFVDRMIKSGHGAMLEHGTVYLYFKYNCYNIQDDIFINKYKNNKYSIVNSIGLDDNLENDYKDIYGEDGLGLCQYAITTNLRVLVENNWLDDLQYLCEPTEYHAKRITVRFVCDRGISHEFVRHRVFSFAQESTRYCNYSKDKFGNEITFIEPCWSYYNPIRDGFSEFRTALLEAENHYLFLLENGWKPQEARAVLPNALKTELVMTGFVEDWINFFKLRTASNAHPQARELAIPLLEELIKREYIEEG